MEEEEGAWAAASAAMRKVAGPQPAHERRRRSMGGCGDGNEEGCRPRARTSEVRRPVLGGCGCGDGKD
jgi:hypothetical protein